jgi:hypothetical protein
LREDLVDDIPQLSVEENEMLTADFTEEEVLEAISEMEHNKAPKPDGFPTEFYKFFWDIIKIDLMNLFVQLKQGNLPLY